jgi:hypothetical protein
MNLKDFSKDLDLKLKNQLISSRVLLDKLRLVDESSRKSGQYQDPLYLPFYYHMGKYIAPKSILQIGLNLGLEICCFLQGSKSPQYFFAFQNNDGSFYSERLAFSNIKDISKKINKEFYYGSIFDDEFLSKLKNFDLILITEKNNFDKIMDALNIFWNNLNLDGFLVVDYLDYDKKIKKIFLDFCKTKNREGIVYETRYGVGIVQK